MKKTFVVTVFGLVAILGLVLVGIAVKDRASDKTHAKQGADSPEQTPPKVVEQDGNSGSSDTTTVPPPGNTSSVEGIAKTSTTVSVPSGHVVIDGKPRKIEEPTAKPPTKRSVVRRPLEPEATKRLHDGPVLVTAVFEASGKGEHASYGKSIRGSYLYTTTVIAQSEILEKIEDKDSGKVFVKERRKFLQSRDNLSLSDMDIAIALDTLPVEKVKDWAKGSCRLVAAVCTTVAKIIPPAAPYLLGAAAAAGTANLSVDGTFDALNKIDGVSARGVLGHLGVTIPENLEKFANDQMAKFAQKQIYNVHVAIQSIEGKSFIVTYEQAKNGAPLNVDYKSEDGKPITEAEWEILRSVNAFLDANVVPDTRCRVGDTWTVWADEVQDLFGAVSKGRSDGKIHVERFEDQKNGDWTLKLEPSTIEFRSEDGTTAGKMQIKKGNGYVDAANASVKSLQATASGNLQALDKKRHCMFFDFVKRIDGNANMRFSLSVESFEKEKVK